MIKSRNSKKQFQKKLDKLAFSEYLICIKKNATWELISTNFQENGANESNVDTIDTCVQYSWSGIPVEKLSDCLEKAVLHTSYESRTEN